MRTVLSFLVDDHPKFLMQGWLLALALKHFGDLDAPGCQLIVHHTRAVAPERLGVFTALGATLRAVEPFGEGAGKYCNKLRQLETAEIRAADRVILMDADILPLQSLQNLDPGPGALARVVDAPNPPEAMLRQLLLRAGRDATMDFLARPFLDIGERTLRQNCNGGFYVLSREAVAALAEPWPRWSRFCLDQADLLADKLIHADQLGLALALLETGLAVEDLPDDHNFPVHLGPQAYAKLSPRHLGSVHYHSNADDHGMPRATGIGWIDQQIAPVTERLTQLRRDYFDNALFWDYRYAHNPALGSGVGSRGGVLDYKRKLLAAVLQDFADRQVVDVGCGDLETTRDLPLHRFLGLDLSPSALAIARAKRPDWVFEERLTGTLPDGSAAAVLCIDVLIHQKSAEIFGAILNDLVRLTDSLLIVTGYDAPYRSGGIVYFHGTLTQHLRDHPDIERVAQIGAYHGAVLLAAVKTGPDTPERQALHATLDRMEAACQPYAEPTAPPRARGPLRRLWQRLTSAPAR